MDADVGDIGGDIEADIGAADGIIGAAEKAMGAIGAELYDCEGGDVYDCADFCKRAAGATVEDRGEEDNVEVEDEVEEGLDKAEERIFLDKLAPGPAAIGAGAPPNAMPPALNAGCACVCG